MHTAVLLLLPPIFSPALSIFHSPTHPIDEWEWGKTQIYAFIFFH